MTEIARIIPTRPDTEIAADLKRRAIELYNPILELCTEAHNAGFEVHISSAMGPLGKHVITLLKVAKVY